MDQAPKVNVPALPSLLDLGPQHLVAVPQPTLGIMLQMAERERANPTMCVPAAQVRQGMFAPAEFEAQPFGVRVFVKRLEVMQPALEYSGYLLGALAAAMGHHPGTAVLYAHAAAAYGARTGKAATLLGLFVKAWDGHLPHAEGLRHTWQAQKVPVPVLRAARQLKADLSDNYMDHRAAWTPEALKAGRTQAERPGVGPAAP